MAAGDHLPDLPRSFYDSEGIGDLLVFLRQTGDQRFLVVLNLGHRPVTFDAGKEDLCGRVALSTFRDREGERFNGRGELRGGGGEKVIVRLDHGGRRSRQG